MYANPAAQPSADFGYANLEGFPGYAGAYGADATETPAETPAEGNFFTNLWGRFRGFAATVAENPMISAGVGVAFAGYSYFVDDAEILDALAVGALAAGTTMVASNLLGAGFAFANIPWLGVALAGAGVVAMWLGDSAMGYVPTFG